MISNNNFWLRENPHITSIATLGPDGSSSQAAAKHLSSLIEKPLEVLLFDTFELASQHVEKNTSCALLVANAYERVDNFYMNADTMLLGSFYYAPPAYYLSCKDVASLKAKISEQQPIRIATHHAPLSRLNGLIKSADDVVQGLSKANLEIEITDSTSKGARQVASNISDCCLANVDALDLYHLHRLSSPLNIEMTWVVFSCNQVKVEEIA
ncbi:hypothetical protein [Vibrio mangrovi]|uniref:Prephenate dehydratase n=1 Tax=Vibrio mangrovi TaxID=474394 RepID=A0A1Y6IVW1_9VIBR|nr:hypothetical protein [Vibrio mangrovi]MDW6004670.1 hypothetical protein [Vibrio mangrovi]SMS00960.1 Prephenate dehydratase [Vibrio mangrovi]